MEVFAGALLILTIVILIVSISYLIITTRHKERLKLLEKGYDPKEIMGTEGPNIVARIGALFLGIGLGFMLALIFDEFIVTTNENPAIYPGMIFICAGIGQLIINKKHTSKNSTNHEA